MSAPEPSRAPLYRQLRPTAGTLFTVVGVVIGVIVAVVLFQLARDRTSLTLELTSTTPIVSPAIAEAQGISIVVVGVGSLPPDTRELWVSGLRLANSGNQVIRSSDFESPIVVRLMDGAILDVRIGASDPTHLKPQIAMVGEQSIEIQSLLLNPGDAISFLVFSTRPLIAISVEARIAGVRELVLASSVSDRSENAPILAWWVIVLLMVLTVALAAVIFGFLYTRLNAAHEHRFRREMEDLYRRLGQEPDD